MQKKKIYISLLFFLIFISGTKQISAQYTQLTKPDQAGEFLEMFSDRSVYIVGEELNFKLVYGEPERLTSRYFSKVIYVELIKWNGAKLAQTKVPLMNGHTQGFIKIPEELESGNYYLRAYTKWMRNYSPYNYLYHAVKIVNPLSTKTEQRPLESSRVLPDKRGRSSREVDFVRFSDIKNEYQRGEEITFELELNGEKSASDYCLSVSSEHSLDLESRAFTFTADNQDPASDAIDFLPELRGLSLSGKAVDRINGEPLVNSRVYLSSVRNAVYFSAGKTDSSGNFLFTFPRLEEDLEFHLTSEKETAKLLIDTDFCNRPVTLAFIPFFLEENEKVWITNLARKAQLQQRFPQSEWVNEDTVNKLPFYGKADRIIYEKEFIELNDLEEFFYELVYEVAVRRKDGKVYLDLAAQSTLSSYPVLVLLDNIPVRNIDELLKVSCRSIDRIEILSRGYVLGESLHSGIVSIFSEKNDMAGLMLGQDSHFFTLEMPAYPDTYEDHRKLQDTEERLPVIQNTLYWNPNVNILPGEQMKISFYSGDLPGKYEISLRGLDLESGEMLHLRKTIEVK